MQTLEQHIISQEQERANLKLNDNHDSHDEAMLDLEETRSATSRSSDENSQPTITTWLPTFTNKVAAIRPFLFCENTDCQTDNKFMKTTGFTPFEINKKVSSFHTRFPSLYKSQSLLPFMIINPFLTGSGRIRRLSQDS